MGQLIDPRPDLLHRFVDGFPDLTFYRDDDAGLDELVRSPDGRRVERLPAGWPGPRARG